MGVFNTLLIDCPVCLTECEEQTKPGDMDTFKYNEKNGEVFRGHLFTCSSCSHKFYVDYETEPRFIIKDYIDDN